MSDDLVGFVRDALAKGMSRHEIASVLIAAGWPEKQVADALRAFAEVSSPVPVPRPRPYVSAGEAVTYLVFFATLYITAYSLGALAFDLIDTWIPDPAGHRTPAAIAQSIRWGMSWLIVTFPIVLFIGSRVVGAERVDPSMRQSRIRRRLAYATLFFAGAVLIGDLTTLVYYTLGGELTIRFVLKVLVVALIAGAVFAIFYPEVRVEPEPGQLLMRQRVMAAAATIVVLAGLALGVAAIGDPREARVERLDEERVDALQRISDAVTVYHERHGRLPGALDELRAFSNVRLADPATGQPFEYRVTGAAQYELCAVFARATPADARVTAWRHGAGRHCFTLAVRDAQ